MEPDNSYKGFTGTEDSFLLHLDLRDNGELLKLLVSPVEDDFVVTLDGIHLCTLKHYCESWHLANGRISDETAVRIGDAIENFYSTS
ncbi:MAG: hypothetical protein K0S09_2302 [Sphingobacteriaceae bacterium]|jgi:hypothetical protein|nr:hypothetical protein [Sphingobacteriaceae bacterium]